VSNQLVPLLLKSADAAVVTAESDSHHIRSTIARLA